MGTENLIGESEEERANYVKRFIMQNALQPCGPRDSIYGKFRVKTYPKSNHKWKFFKDDSQYEEIKKELYGTELKHPSVINAIPFNIQYNKRTLVAYEHAYAWNLGFKIDQGDIELDVLDTTIIERIEIFANQTKDNKVYTFDDLLEYIIDRLNLAELVQYVYYNSQELIADAGLENLYYLVYHSSNLSLDSSKIKTMAVTSLKISGFNVTLSYAESDPNSLIGYLSEASRIVFNIDPVTDKVTFLASDFDDLNRSNGDVRGELKGIKHTDIYTDYRKILLMVLPTFFSSVYLTLTSISNYIDRKHDVKNIADREYTYKEHDINREEIRNGAIKYNKYLHTKSTNDYYPDERKSPRCHKRNGYYRKQWVGSRKDGTRHLEERYVHECLVNPQNEKMTYNDNVIKTGA